MILSGHPTGNPNSHEAFKAFADANQLYAVCVPWIPSKETTRFLSTIPFLRPAGLRLARRNFTGPEILTIQGRLGEFSRLALRASGVNSERLAYQANDWLMRKSCKYVERPLVTAVHAYEDCALLQFQAAQRLGKACIYDMPIGYYPSWQSLHSSLSCRYAEWVDPHTQPSSRFARPSQKREEMQLASLVLAPSTFVANTIKEWSETKRVAIVRYGIDLDFWRFRDRTRQGPLRFLYAGNCSIRKGVPLLLEAWKAADLKDAELRLVGGWNLKSARLKDLPRNAYWSGPVDRFALRDHLWSSDCLVAPTFFEGRALIVGEAMATGMPVISTPSSGCDDLIGHGCGAIVPTGDIDALVEALRWFAASRDELPGQSLKARKRAEQATWSDYRFTLRKAVSTLL